MLITIVLLAILGRPGAWEWKKIDCLPRSCEAQVARLHKQGWNVVERSERIGGDTAIYTIWLKRFRLDYSQNQL